MKKILWVLNSPIGIVAEVLEGKRTQSGTWIDATLQALLGESSDWSVAIAAYNTAKKMVTVHERLEIVGIGYGSTIGSRPGRDNSQKTLAELFDLLKPDIIQIWGTEFGFGLDVLAAAKEWNIPVLFYIQGIMQALAKYKFGGLKLFRILRHAGILGLPKGMLLLKNERAYCKQVVLEKELLTQAAGFICDNEWSKAFLGRFNARSFYHTTPVNQAFLNQKWQPHDGADKSIITISGSYAGKGLHKLLEALCVVKQQYPGIKLIIPGDMRFGWKENPYVSYLRWFIKKNGLEGNVEFTGRLSSEEMAERMLEADVFVTPSYIENISTSLREAMYLGMPCITSQVGSLHEVIHHGENGLSYRYEESEVLAYEILELLTNPEKAQKLAVQAYDSIRKKYPQERLGSCLTEIYKECVAGERS